MVYPATGVPVVVEIAPGANPAGDPGDWTWSDITSSVRLGDRIQITTGRPDEATAVDPGRCALRLDNRSGDFSPRNPLGQWYGQLGRNTPLRVRARRAEDAFGRSTSSGWGTADSGQTWTCSGGSASDYSTSGGMGVHSHSTVHVYRQSVLDVNLVDVEQVVDVQTSVLLTGGALVTGLLARYTDASNYYWLRAELDKDSADVVLKIVSVVAGVETQLAVLDPVPSLAYAANTPLRVRASVVDDRLAIKVWAASDSEPAGWHLEVADSDLTGPGAAGVQTWLVTGNTNTPPVAAAFDNYALYVDRFRGYASSWPPRWDLSGNDATVPIQANGILRRLGQGSQTSTYALRRTVAAELGLLAYWPCEDGQDAGQAASALPGHDPMSASGTIAWAATDPGQPGMTSLPDLSDGGTLTGRVPATGASSPVAWTVQMFAKEDTSGSAATAYVLVEWTDTAGAVWDIRFSGSPNFNTQLRRDGVVVIEDGTSFTSFFEWRVTAVQAGANISVQLIINGETQGDITPGGVGPWTATVASTTLGWPDVARVNPAGATTTGTHGVGHIQVWDGISAPSYRPDTTTDSYGASVWNAPRAFWGEAASDRLARLCAEDGVSITIPAVGDDGITRMGYQQAGTPVDLYRQCEETDQGVLHESGWGLAYLPRDRRYNRPVALELDVLAGQVAEPPEPIDDDQALRNRVVIRRIDGSSSTVQDEASIAAAGVYGESVEVNLSADSVLSDHAAWRLHLGTADEMRWPRVDVNLAASPELVDAVLSCGVQSRMTVANPPPQAAGDDIDLIVEGYTETIGYKDWGLSYTCSPAQPWQIAEVDGDQRVAADGSTLAAALAEEAMALSLASTAENGPWTTDPADMPLDIRVGGERITVSAITGTTSPQTVTISQRGVNGVTRSWPAGTEVDVWQPAIVPL